MTQIDWDAPKGTRGSGECSYAGCDESGFAAFAVTVRRRPKGSDGKLLPGGERQVVSLQRTFCKAHCETLYAEASALVLDSTGAVRGPVA
jgi:hypothetical protein